MVLVWFRKGEDKTLLGAGFGVSRATAYRYVAEAITVLAAQAPDLHTALRRVARRGLVPRDPRRETVHYRPPHRDSTDRAALPGDREKLAGLLTRLRQAGSHVGAARIRGR